MTIVRIAVIIAILVLLLRTSSRNSNMTDIMFSTLEKLNLGFHISQNNAYKAQFGVFLNLHFCHQ